MVDALSNETEQLQVGIAVRTRRRIAAPFHPNRLGADRAAAPLQSRENRQDAPAVATHSRSPAANATCAPRWAPICVPEPAVPLFTEPAPCPLLQHVAQQPMRWPDAAVATSAPRAGVLAATARAAADSAVDPLELHWCNAAIHCCADDTACIYAALHEMESRRRPRPDYLLALQSPHLNARMRAILVDWLVEVAEEYRFSNESLHLAIAYMDRYLSRKTVTREMLQLLGVACMLVAAKFEEIVVPLVDDFVFISAETYTREQVKAMEAEVLNALQFELCDATALPFLHRYMHAARLSRPQACLATFLCELALLDYQVCAQARPSHRAAAAVWIAAEGAWTVELQRATFYRIDPLAEGAVMLAARTMMHLWHQCCGCNEGAVHLPAPEQLPQHLRCMVEKFAKPEWCAVARQPATSAFPSALASALSASP